jgi:hypothetical protein
MTAPDLRAALEAVLGRPLTSTPHRDTAEDDAAIDRAEEARLFDDGWIERDLDDMADAQAANDWAHRGGIA